MISGIADQPEQTAYAVSKAGVDKYVRDFAPKLRGTGVQTNLLDPGWLRTDLGGPNAPGDPASVLPGALVPALLGDGTSGRYFRAQDYAGLALDAALQKPTPSDHTCPAGNLAQDGTHPEWPGLCPLGL